MTDYPNLKESTGYPDDILGLGGVNCRHRQLPFVPGISTPNPLDFSEEENAKAYALSQQQRKLERDMRKLKKKRAAAKAVGDKETEKKLKEKIKLKSDEIDKFCEDNNLRRDHSRELVTEQITKKVAKSGNDGIIEQKQKIAADDVHFVGKIDKKIYSCVTEDIVTDEVIITDRQIEHIKEQHPNNFEEYNSYFKAIIEKPDYIIEANKPNSALILKKFVRGDKEFKMVLRLITSEDNQEYKNSIITFMKIDDKEWNRLLRNKKILYKSE